MKTSLPTSLSPEPGPEETHCWREQLDKDRPAGKDRDTKGVQRESREGILEEGAFERRTGVQKERRCRNGICCCPEAMALTGGL